MSKMIDGSEKYFWTKFLIDVSLKIMIIINIQLDYLFYNFQSANFKFDRVH